MTARDPDIAALARRLGLRGLRYRSFAPAPLPPAPLRTEAPEVLPEPAQMVEPPVVEPIVASAPVMPPSLPPSTPPLPPAWATPPAAAWPAPASPVAHPALPVAPPVVAAPVAPAAPSPSFPLLGAALTVAGQRAALIPDTVPEAARPFAALRFAVSGADGAQGS